MAKSHSLNHIAVSMPTGALDPAARADIYAFYGEVFGWSRFNPVGEPGDPLVMLMADPKCYLYIADDETGEGTVTRPMVDHLGIEIEDEAEFDEILERAKNYKAKDDRVRIVDKLVTKHEADADLRPDLAEKSNEVTMISCYIGYILPLLVELQLFQ
jgi:hypothetical protein